MSRADRVDAEVRGAMGESFLVKLPPELLDRLLAEGQLLDYPPGTVAYRAGSPAIAVLVVHGLFRVSIASPQGRRVTLMYARRGEVLGHALAVGPAPEVDVETLEASRVFSINLRTLAAAAGQDARVAFVIAEELNGRLRLLLQQVAVHAFGSVKQRVAWHLLSLASIRQGQLIALVSQQHLADAVGSVREVVSRALRELRLAGIISTAGNRIRILDATRLHNESFAVST